VEAWFRYFRRPAEAIFGVAIQIGVEQPERRRPARRAARRR